MTRRSIILTAALAAALMAPMLAGCSENPATGRNELVLISKQEEIRIGNEAAPEFEKEFGGRVKSDRLQDYVSRIGRTVAAKSEREMPYEFALLRSETPNAFALPGGSIYITAGLMSRMTNERQLAAVLGHEVGHVAARHSVQQLQQQMGASVLVQLAGAAAGEKEKIAETAASVAANMALMNYSRDDEREADRLGIRYMEKADFNPWGMVELLTVLKDLSDREPSSVESWFQTHPLTSERIERAEELIEDTYEERWRRDNPDPYADRFMDMRELLVRQEGL